MAEPIVVESKFRRKVQLSTGVVVKAGDVLYHDGTAYAFADASAVASHGQLVALEAGDGDATDVKDEVEAAPYAIIQDADAPFTQDALQYLSETGTSGNTTTETRPTTAGALRQVIGRAHSGELIEIDLRTSEVVVPLSVKFATSANALLDSGNFGGPTLDAQNETAVLDFNVPENVISVSKAVLRVAAEASAGTPTADITVGSNLGDDTQHDAVTADATLVNQSTEGSAADAITELDLSTGLDATDIIRPGATVSIKVLKDDAGTDIVHVIGGYVVFKVAG